jgi:hypothetical protein
LQTAQLLALFLQGMRKIDKFFRTILSDEAAADLPEGRDIVMNPLAETLDEDQVAVGHNALFSPLGAAFDLMHRPVV